MTHVALGIDIGGTSIKGGLVSATGVILEQQSLPTPLQGGAALLEQVRTLCQQLWQRAHAHNVTPIAIGVGTPGVVDPRQKCVVGGCPNIPDWVGQPFIQVLEQEFQVPVSAHNDVTLMSLGEAKFGAGQGKEHVVCIALGTGLGGGIIIHGNVYDGASLYAGEVGHMKLVPQGRTCGCGAQGCWEAYCSATGLLNQAKTVLPNESNLTPKMIFDQHAQEPYSTLVREFAYFLGLGISNLINIFNPQMVIVGGGIAGAGECLWEPTHKTIKENTMANAYSAVSVVPAKLGTNAGLLGAAAFAWKL